MALERHLRPCRPGEEGRHHRGGQDLRQLQRGPGKPRSGIEDLRHADGLDMRPDGKGLCCNEDRQGRRDGHPEERGVPDLQVLLQDGLRHGQDQGGGEELHRAAQVLHLQVKGGQGAHPLRELRQGQSRGRGDVQRDHAVREEMSVLYH